MLFRAAILERIRSGEVTLAFRRWRRPTVKAGGALRTPVGVLAIEAVEAYEPRHITEANRRRAGFETLDDLFASLDTPQGGTVYRIRFHVAGSDPRVALRSNAHLTNAELHDIRNRLTRFDETSGAAPWTKRVLALIASREGITAAAIAAEIGVEKESLKRNVRKLKELGLTESLPAGYRISPRGESVLAALAKAG